MGEGVGFIASVPWEASLQPKFTDVLAHCAEVGATNVAAIGFCWGIWTICKAAQTFPGRLSCAAWPHPSMAQLEAGLHKGDPVLLGVAHWHDLLL